MFTVIEYGCALVVLAVFVTHVLAPAALGQRVFPLLRRQGRAERDLTAVRDERAARDLAVDPNTRAAGK